MELRGVESIGEILGRLAALESGQPTPAATKSSSGSGSGSGGTGPSKPRSSSAGSSFTATAVAPALENELTAQDTQANTTLQHEEAHADLAQEATPIDRIKAVIERQKKMLLVTVLDSAQSLLLDQGELCIEFSPESRHFRDTLAKPENIKILREACQEVTGQETAVRIAVKDPEAQNQALSPEDEERLARQNLRSTAESNPMVQEMLRKFRGEIVDVRRVEK
jgi:hypothetical protein